MRSGQAPSPASGYRNLFGELAAGEAFEGYGAGRTRDILSKLARHLEKPYPWASVQPKGVSRDDNPEIPSGYTYLAQLVAHDLTFLGSTLPPLGGARAEQRNLRTIALNLETIYGGGPVERPSSFFIEAGGALRLKLRLGVIGDADNRIPAPSEERAGLARDLPRASCPMTADAGPGAGDCLTEVLISDPRNDDHLIVAQTAVLFHHLHNAVCDRLVRSAPRDNGRARLSSATARDLFASARRLVTAVYREIVRGDLMERLLCAPVYASYEGGSGRFLDAEGGAGMPVEFSHAAFRVGHAMVRPGYIIRERFHGLEDVLRFNSDLMPEGMPPGWSWIVQWSRFYELDGPPANLSRRIAPSQTRTLFTSPLISVSDDPKNRAAVTGLPRRDLLRGDDARVRSVASLIRHVERAAPDLVAGSRLLNDPAHRRDAILRFLAEPAPSGDGQGLSDDDKEAIAANPPLLLFLLLEAAVEQDGLCLGTLGSVIVAEVIFRALDDAARADAGRIPDVATLARDVFGDKGMPSTMPDLIRFVGDLPALSGVRPAFI